MQGMHKNEKSPLDERGILDMLKLAILFTLKSI